MWNVNRNSFFSSVKLINLIMSKRREKGMGKTKFALPQKSEDILEAFFIYFDWKCHKRKNFVFYMIVTDDLCTIWHGIWPKKKKNNTPCFSLTIVSVMWYIVHTQYIKMLWSLRKRCANPIGHLNISSSSYCKVHLH